MRILKDLLKMLMRLFGDISKRNSKLLVFEC